MKKITIPTKEKYQKPITSIFRWAGSKKKLLPILSSLNPPKYNRYVEPFAGSACLFFKLQPKQAVLGDINKNLISTYMEIKYRLPKVLLELNKLKKGKKYYKALRAQNPADLNSAQRAARFIYLNRFCFNGLYRTNLKGEFNVPYGGNKSGKLPTKELLTECARALRNVRLVSGDFKKTLAYATSNDFVYMDPPYFANSRRIFKEYDKDTFSLTDLQRLRIDMDELNKKGINFLVSYAKCKEAAILIDGYNVREVSVRRSIAGFSRNRRDARELMIWNY